MVGWAGWTLLTLALVGIAWIAVTGLLARSQLEKARAELPAVRNALLAGNEAEAQLLAAQVADHAGSAHALVSGPAWWVGAHLPGIGTPLTTTRTIATSADAIGKQALPGLVDLAGLVGSDSLRHGPDINISVLAHAKVPIDKSLAVLQRASESVAQSPSSTWLTAVDQARASLTKQLTTLTDYLQGADRALRIMLPALGVDHEQRYFVAFENEAESRGLGGLPGAFAIVTANDGRLQFTHFGSDTELIGTDSGVTLPSDYLRSYGTADPASDFRNSDMSPNFPYAARIWAGMWQAKTGQHITGAIALDPTALSYMLRATGPTVLPDGTQVGAWNVVKLTESRQYSKFSGRLERQAWLVGLSRAVAHKLTSTNSVIELGRAVTIAAAQRRVVVWSSSPVIEKSLVAAGYAGVLPTSGPVSSFAVNNAAGNKLDYYLNRAMTYRRSGCGTGASAIATLTLTDNAPRHGLPHYVTQRADHPPAGAKVGDNHLIVSYYATAGSSFARVTVDGKPHTYLSSTENGLSVALLDVELKVGVPVHVTITTREPAQTSKPALVLQPLARPITVSSSGPDCGS